MAVQTLIVAALVSGCFVYAAWHLMPGALKRPLAKGLLRLPWPLAWRTPLQVAAGATGGCGGCGGCDSTPLKKTATNTQPLVFHPRKTL